MAEEKLEGDLLDMGCGYGVIGIVMKKMNPSLRVTSVDVNPRAVELTKLNAEKNQTQLIAFESDGYKEVKTTFHTILTNPPIRAGKKVIYQMFEDAYTHLDENGRLIAVIRRQQGAESAVKKFTEIFGNCEILVREKGFWVLSSKKLTN